MQKDILNAESKEQFDAWKEDILRSIRSVMLTGKEHWVTVIRLIATCLDEDVYQTIDSFIPDNYRGLEELNPAELLRNIEVRLVTADQLELKRLHFELAKQTMTENPWRFENCLSSYYRSAWINDESRFMDIYKKGVHNNELRKLLLLHDPSPDHNRRFEGSDPSLSDEFVEVC